MVYHTWTAEMPKVVSMLDLHGFQFRKQPIPLYTEHKLGAHIGGSSKLGHQWLRKLGTMALLEPKH